MKFTVFCLLLILNSFVYSQNLKNVLEGYTVSKIPTDRSIVGSKWVSDMGATTAGLPEDKLIISNSLNQASLDKENSGYLNIALLSMLNLSGYSTSDLKVIFNDLKIYTLSNLYDLPLSSGEKIVFSSVKATSFDLEFDKNLSGMILAKIPVDGLQIDAEVELGNKKRISISGANLFVAHKIVKIEDVKSITKSKPLKSGFSIKNIMGYDLSFNVNELVNKVEEKVINEIGIDSFNKLGSLDTYIRSYSKLAKMKLTVMSSEKGGDISIGILNKTIEICYCELLGLDRKLYLINVMNKGDQITFDYVYINDVGIHYDILPSQFSQAIGMLSTAEKSRVSVISKTYIITPVVD